MQSIFRIYARTTKQNDKYLYNELVSLGLQPKYEELLHSFYFNANFNQLFKLSFEAVTVQSLYLQLGHRYPLSTDIGENQKSVGDFLRKVNFRSYIPIQRGIVENTTLKLLIRQSSQHLPSQNVIISILQNYLQKQIILKQYRKMNNKQQRDQLQNYYDIKQIVEKKWQFEDIAKEKQKSQELLEGGKEEKKLIQGLGRSVRRQRKQDSQIEEYKEKTNQLAKLFDVPYSPHFIMYIRRNHARMLLKLNTQSLHKFGWKKNIGWGPIRETLTASILYRTGLIKYFKQKKEINLWDPFCGSGTIPLVALSMAKQLKVRRDHASSFIWSKWPIYKESYLAQYFENSKIQNKETKVKIFCSDIDMGAVNNTVNNFKEFISKNAEDLKSNQQNEQNFMHIKPSDQIFQILPKSIYIGYGDFQTLPQKLLHSRDSKTTILTNLPYLGQRSKQHHPLNQLHSIYRRFTAMIKKYQQYIDNVFVIVDADVHNRNHFMKVSKSQWRILEHFSNGGIQVCLLGWAGNKVGWGEIEVYKEKVEHGVVYSKEKEQNLEEYRREVKQIQNKIYRLPAHLDKKQGLKKAKRVMEKKRVRHMLAAYTAFARRRDRNQIFEKYARKNLALRLSLRGQSWKRRNIALLNNKVTQNQGLIRKQFQKRIEQAIQRSEQQKQKKTNKKATVQRKW